MNRLATYVLGAAVVGIGTVYAFRLGWKSAILSFVEELGLEAEDTGLLDPEYVEGQRANWPDQ